MARCRNRNRWWWWWHENVQRNRGVPFYMRVFCVFLFYRMFIISYFHIAFFSSSSNLKSTPRPPASPVLLPPALPFLSSSSHKETSPSVQRTTLLIRKPKHQVDSLHNGIGLWVVGVYEQTTANERGSGRKCKTNSEGRRITFHKDKPCGIGETW